jgi:hypothetical protein
MIPAETKLKIEQAASLLVAGRLAMGQSVAQVRREVAKRAAAVIADFIGDQWEQELVMAEFLRGINKALSGR